MTSQDFYATLPTVDDLWALADPAAYVAVPDDWYVLVTDVCGSTAAVQAGRYKDVNMLGASSIIAVLNVLPGAEIPFIFGGDGASMVVPPWHLAAARQALLGVRQLAATAYDLDLRVGVVPVAVVSRHRPLKVAKFRQSAQYCQASFIGGGITFATELIKQDPLYRLEPKGKCAEANLTGLECRWQEVPSPQDHTLSLIVTALGSAPAGGTHIYQEVVEAIGRIFGDPEAYHPVSMAGLQLAFSPGQLGAEVRLRSPTASIWARWQYQLRVWAENLLGMVFMRFGLTAGGVNWGEYKSTLRAATDFQKLDDVLRMVIAGTSAQTQQLVRYLEQRSQSGHLAYGLHISDRAVLTCLIMNRQSCHFHLIDGAGGGYTLAAKAMKAQLRSKAENWRTYSHLASYRRSPSFPPKIS